MTRMLIAEDGQRIATSPTTTAKLASRMLAASAVTAKHLPAGTYAAPVLDILLMLHVAEEDARYIPSSDLAPSGQLSAETTQRWIRVLERGGLVDRQHDLLALSCAGHELVSNLLAAIYHAQRDLD